MTNRSKNLGLVSNERCLYIDCTSALKFWKILTINDFIDDFGQRLSKSKGEIQKKLMKILQKSKKLLNFFDNLKSMTNYLPFETNRRVLAQLVEKCQALEDSYFQVQQKVKNQKKTWSEITYVFHRNVVPRQIL